MEPTWWVRACCSVAYQVQYLEKLIKGASWRNEDKELEDLNELIGLDGMLPESLEI